MHTFLLMYTACLIAQILKLHCILLYQNTLIINYKPTQLLLIKYITLSFNYYLLDIWMQEKGKEKVQKFFCPKNKESNFCCAQPSCAKIAIKCINSNECASCRVDHARCPRQIRIDKIFTNIKQKANKCPANKLPINFQDLLKNLINQLTNIREQFLKYNLKHWGLSFDYANLLFNSQIKDQKSRLIAQLLDSDPVFPQARFYMPPQFKKDVDSVQKINNQLNKRIYIYFNCYKLLAQSDCEMKTLAVGVLDPKKEKIFQIGVIKIKQLHRKLKQAIMDRLGLDNKFAGEDQPIQQTQIQDYHNIGERLLTLTNILVQIFYQNKNYRLAQQFIRLNFDLFNEDRKQFALSRVKFVKNIEELQQFQAYCAYQLAEYEISFKFFIAYSENKLNAKLLNILVHCCEVLQKMVTIKLKYLLLLFELDKNNISVVGKILQCYKLLKMQIKIYEFSNILNNLMKFRQLKIKQKRQYLDRLLFIIYWEELHQDYINALTNINEAIKNIRDDDDLFQYELRLRYKLIILQRYLDNDYYNTAKNAIQISQRKLQKFKAPVYQQQIKMTKQYLIKFMNIYAEGMINNNRIISPEQVYRTLEKSIRLSQQLKIKTIEPYLMRARLSNQYNLRTAFEQQLISNIRYPTDTCYLNIAYLLYKQAMLQHPVNNIMLKESLSAIENSLLLKPNQFDLFFLRAIVNQNLGKYRQSNKDLLICIKQGKDIFNCEKKMAENNELIIKHESGIIGEEEKNQLLVQAQKLYEKCLAQKSNDTKCILGYGRILKLSKKYPQATIKFNKVMQSQFKSQAYMFLGNIKEEEAKANDDRDFDLLEEALELYLKAGKIRENKDNVIRIYKELDLQKKAEEVEKQIDWI